ncbi:MAG: hypothetical protein OCD02_07575 [Spirochaetaceae bacterium]
MKQILAIVVALIPLVYSTYLYLKVKGIIKNSTEDEQVEQDKKIQNMKRSASIFLFVGVFMVYQYYKLFIA